MTREERAAAVARLAAEGIGSREIASRLGISRGYVRDLICDPTGAKNLARKASYRGTCETCGATTDGSNGRAAAPTTCARCEATRLHAERYWTPETVLAAVAAADRVAVEVLGRSLRASDWTLRFPSASVSLRRAEEDERLWAELETRGVDVPDMGVIFRELGSWRACADRLGIEASPRGGAARRTIAA